jgi:hypothetical protein
MLLYIASLPVTANIVTLIVHEEDESLLAANVWIKQSVQFAVTEMPAHWFSNCVIPKKMWIQELLASQKVWLANNVSGSALVFCAFQQIIWPTVLRKTECGSQGGMMCMCLLVHSSSVSEANLRYPSKHNFSIYLWAFLRAFFLRNSSPLELNFSGVKILKYVGSVTGSTVWPQGMMTVVLAFCAVESRTSKYCATSL